MPKTLLVLDDSATIQEAVRDALAGEDWTVIAAGTVDEAMEEIRSRRPDAVLCDVSPGDEDGYEVCRRIREMPEGADIPVILMGGQVGPAAAGTAGAAGVLPKPFSSDELVHALADAVEAHSLAIDDAPMPPPPEGAEGPAPDAPQVEEEEVEIIDLSDEEAFSDLELLEDLEPIEPEPLSLDELEVVGEPLKVDAPRAESGDGGADLGELDLGELELDLGEAEPLGGEPASEAPGEPGEGLKDSFAIDLAGPPEEPSPEPEAPAPEEPAPAPGADGAAAPEEDVEGLVESFGPETGPEPPQEAAGPEGAPAPAPEEPADAAFTAASIQDEIEVSLARTVEEEPAPPEEPPAPPPEEAALPESPESYVEEGAGWEHPGVTPPHEGDWDREAPAPEGLSAAVERTVREALEQSLSAEALAPVVQATVERVVWEVVPQMAERLIQEAIERLQKEPPPA